MGIQHWGAFGGFQKKTGPLVGHWTNGQNVITAIPHPSLNPPTTRQLDARERFSIMIGFHQPINSLLKIGFSTAKKEKQSELNAAFKENYPAVGATSPFEIDFSKIMLSKGTLAELAYPELATVPGGLKFDWSDYFFLDSGSPTDKVNMVVYNSAKNRFVVSAGVTNRSVETYTMTLPGDFIGDMLQVWVSLFSDDKKKVSNSNYVGELIAV